MPRPTHLITNLAYRLKPHHTRNLYLRARLDTCADVNLMPASMYQLVFNDAKMQKLAPSKLQVGTYTTDIVNIVGSCTFYLVHPDTKKQIYLTTWLNTTKTNIGLPPTKIKLHYKHSRSPQENKSSITYTKKKCLLKQQSKKWPLKHQLPRES